MNNSQVIIMAVLVAAMGLFLWGRWRHDLVAMAALLACELAGVVPANDAFSGFGHPAVITVACVLVLSQGLHNTGCCRLAGAQSVAAQRRAPDGYACAYGSGRGHVGVHE